MKYRYEWRGEMLMTTGTNRVDLDPELDWLRSQFETDGNPLWLWDAFHLWGEAASLVPHEPPPLPPWIVNGLLHTSDELLALDPKGGKYPEKVQRALGLHTRGGGHSKHTQWQNAKRLREHLAGRAVLDAKGDGELLKVNLRRADDEAGRLVAHQVHKGTLGNPGPTDGVRKAAARRKRK